MKYFAAIDVGSNAIRLKVASWNGRTLNCIYKHRAPVRIGADVFSTGQIKKATQINIVDTFLEYRLIASLFPKTKIRAVATSAFREAKNGLEVRNWIQKQTRTNLSIIGFREEAALIHSAVKSFMPDLNTRSILMDIGGGSVEFVRFFKGVIEDKITLPVGTVRVLSKSTSIPEMRDFIESFRNELRNFIYANGKAPEQVIGTGGNVEAFWHLKKNFFFGTSKPQLKLRQLNLILNELSELSPKMRSNIFLLRPDRADVIIPALITTQMFLEVSGQDKLIIPRVGLKEGVLIDLARKSQ